MSVQIEQGTPDSLSVELVVEENDQECWVLLAHLSAYLYANYGVDIDCDRIVVTLVYA